jgi:exopolyphosphatase/guanosine-5'-triphosphate,3'-diphosphate pyrophosphatase
MRKAIIDLGTNTFNLLVADLKENGFDIVHSEKDGVALGMGGINDNRIAEPAIQRGIATLIKFLDKCSELKVDKIWAFGTSALRDAKNTEDVLARIESKIGLKIKVISGNEEAQLIFDGVKQLYDFNTPAVIIDIGGGSTEVIFGGKNGVTEMKSLNIGVSRIYQQFDFSDPFVAEDIQTIRDFLDKNTEGFFDNRSEEVMVGSSGSFETFHELIHQDYFPKELKCHPIEKSTFEKVLWDVIKSTYAEREANPFILPIRKKMAPTTAVKILWMMEKLKTERILVSPYALKEGALIADRYLNI